MPRVQLLLSVLLVLASALQPWDGLLASARRWLAAAPMLRRLSGPGGILLEPVHHEELNNEGVSHSKEGAYTDTNRGAEPVYATVVTPRPVPAIQPQGSRLGGPSRTANEPAAPFIDRGHTPAGVQGLREVKEEAAAPAPLLREVHPLTKQAWGSRGRRLGMGLVTGVEGKGGSVSADPALSSSAGSGSGSGAPPAETTSQVTPQMMPAEPSAQAESEQRPVGLAAVLAGAAEDEQLAQGEALVGQHHAGRATTSGSNGPPSAAFAGHEFPTADKLLADSMSQYLQEHSGDLGALESAAAAVPRIATAVLTTLQQAGEEDSAADQRA